MSADDEAEVELPLLGEPPSVELANTLYGEDPVDVLADPAVARRWVARPVQRFVSGRPR